MTVKEKKALATIEVSSYSISLGEDIARLKKLMQDWDNLVGRRDMDWYTPSVNKTLARIEEHSSQLRGALLDAGVNESDVHIYMAACEASILEIMKTFHK